MVPYCCNNMDVKQELCDPHECVIKTEAVLMYDQTVEDQNEFKQECIKLIVPKIEEGHDYPSVIDPELVCEYMENIATTIKQELENPSEITATGFSDMKEDVSESIPFNNESKLLTSKCNLPTLDSENNDYPVIESLKRLNNCPKDVSKKLKTPHPCLVCQKGVEKLENPTHDQHVSLLGLKSACCIKLFKCDICSKEFKWKTSLQRHLVIHSDEKLFYCDICRQKFTNNYYLQQHLLIHTDEKPFNCHTCSKEFRLKSNLQQHLNIHSKETPFKCDICCKVFNRNSSLQRHLIIHSGEKPFKCDICFKGFNLKTNLERHAVIHANEKPYRCDICFKEFNFKNNFDRHLVVHSNKKPFKCNICFKEYNCKSSLQQHSLCHSNAEPVKYLLLNLTYSDINSLL